MKPTGEGGGGVAEVEGTVAEGSALLIVGVKPDERSREVLTWSLVNVARPGDRIVALHVLDYSLEGSASLISLVRSFDTMLGVYESFCNLKQVDLKLKVFKGKSARKVLVQEVKSCGATSLIVGSSRKHHTIRSSASLAKYCARNLTKDVSVFAVKGGKIMFRRVPTTNDGPHMNLPSLVCGSPDIAIEAAKIGNNFSPARTSSRWTRTSRSSSLQSPQSLGVNNSLALVPVQTNETDSGSLESGPRWHFLRGLYSNRKSWTKVSAKKAVLQWVSRLRGRHSSATLYLDKKQSDSGCDEDCSSSVDGDDVSISRFGSELMQSPLSPFIGSNNIPEELEGLHERYSSTCRLFTYEEVLSMTSNFSSDNLIGEGGNSYVYRGDLPDGRELAVKILKPCLDVLKEFILEIEVITSVNHKNIVSLFGFCFENNNLMLVYDYLPRGSLEENLHGNRKDSKSFGWLERYKVAVGVAEALDYLHNTHDPEVIHRDVKSSNVLLADDFEPQLSDFGFASLASSASQHVSGLGVTVDAYEDDNRQWKKHVKAYKRINSLLDTGRYRNIMDMNAGFGGFAAALESPKLWVMNVVPTIAEKNRLGVVYERGLIGIYHDWCEAFSTYPRTYDLIHANHLFSLYKNKCNADDILLEMDRILRPEGAVIIRDDVDTLIKVKKIIAGMRWDSKLVDHEDGPLIPEKVLIAVKQYWVTNSTSTH